MSLPHWSYVAMLAFCLVGTLPLVVLFRLRVLHQPRRLVLTILAAGLPFLAWDLWATHAGQWHFDAAQTLPPRVAGLPLEEIAFFVVIPLVSVITYEAVAAVGGGRGVLGRSRSRGSIADRPGVPRSEAAESTDRRTTSAERRPVR